ncbi:NitT/TauT family transport system permease protein [Rhodopseudomonas thermotolerans]|uniref:NitT/TauT family transport system permease protein n=2 Tax=Rhodopseudomonas TaxID=1073 RepID=A0A336JVZ4_9BRAD|nr:MULTISPECIES: ABC transporter permease [Rhodopseudomonas]RED29027.1 NitT/TauT family transport system permease protein [Rhodopseudomonas pentothenatexigens]REF92264.1 NitT/TauT family transport system permease protein [Rhodopseudomonas thermotolerans]SSW92439.1 NitT/TauT family transport system permease protein [Rhodopseudomonas pentothenatexigens]
MSSATEVASRAGGSAVRPALEKVSATQRLIVALDTHVGRTALQTLAVVAFFLLWEFGVRMGWVSEFLVGKPSGIWLRFEAQLLDGSLFVDSGYTLYEALIGFVVGTIVGSVLGLAMWYSIFVARMVEPFIVALNSVPKIALAPVILLWFGTGLLSKVVLVVSMTALVALIAAYQAAKDSDKDLQSLMLSMGGSKHQIFYSVVVPSSLPAIIATFRINIGFALVGAVVGEFISSKRGLGHLVYNASSLYDLNSVWVGLFVLMFMGFVLYHGIDALERYLLPWKQDAGHVRIQA